ncbi:MAG: flippase [Alphaproteobacteria bacterium]|nr:flippase [Alphaproteobacteria bacterium]
MNDIKALVGNKIAQGALGTFGLNICNQLFLFLTLTLLTRLMTAEDFGLYSVILSTVTLISLPFIGGFTTFTMRHVASYKAKEEWGALRGLLQFSLLWVIFGTIIFISISYVSFNVLELEKYVWGLPTIFLMPLLLYFGAISRGLKKVVQGRFFEFFLQPFIFFSLCIAAHFKGVELTVIFALQFYAISIVIGILCSAFFALRSLPKNIKQKAYFRVKEWVHSAIPLIFAVGLVVANMNIDIVMVGALAGEEDAGQYRVASRMAAFVLFILFALNNAVSPRISALYATGEKEKLQRIITTVSRAALVLTLPIAIILFVFAEGILSLAFGNVFAAASVALMILIGANLFSVAMGQVGQVLSLTGYEKYTAVSVLIAVLINVSLNAYLVPQMGMNGAAIATGVSIVVWNTLLAFWSVQKTGLYCTALGPIGKRAF